MSLRWLYIILVVVTMSWLRYISYKRSRRVEEKLDLILNTLGVDQDGKKTVETTVAPPEKLNPQNDIDVVVVESSTEAVER